MLRTIRLTLAVIFFALITLLFLDFTGTLHAWFGWMAKIQFLPAVLALNIGVVLFLAVLTLVFGRIYCSVICPLGVFQDIVSWLSAKRKKNRFRYSSALKWLRYGVLGVFVLAIIGGLNSFVVLLAPYSSYGRIVSSLFSPLYQWANNGLAYLAERADSYAFYETDVWMKSLPTLLIATVTLVVLIVLAWRGGRTYCNTICPVGTVLGFLSKYSLLKPVIDTKKCNSCGLCARNCKASCINIKALRGMYGLYQQVQERCHHLHTPQADLRCSLPGNLRGTGAGKRRPPRISLYNCRVCCYGSPQGAGEESGRWTGCHRGQKNPRARHSHHSSGLTERPPLCTTLHSLPALRIGMPQPSAPSFFGLDKTDAAGNVLRTRLLPPRMRQVCGGVSYRCHPSDEPRREIGRPNRSCRMDCARHCPAGAIQMVPSDPEDEASIKIPVVNAERCIGCGACENLCPSRPFSAIYVEGHVMHRTV